MNRTELIRIMSADSRLTRIQAGNALDAFLNAVSDALVKGNDVQIKDFGTFKTIHRPARLCHLTGKPQQIAAMNSPVFRASRRLKSVVA